MYNIKTMQVILNGGELLYSMLRDLSSAVNHLPGCKTTANVKKLSDDISATSRGIIQTMRNIAADTKLENSCEICDEEFDEDCEDLDEDNTPDSGNDAMPSADDLTKFFDTLADLLSAGVPITVSADIYVGDRNSNDSNNDKEDN